MNTAEKIKQLNEKFDTLQPGFEQDFIKYNAERIAHVGADVVNGKPYKATEKVGG